MTLYSFIGIAVTSATAIIFGQTIWDPVQVLARLGNPIRGGRGDGGAAAGHAKRERRGKSGLAVQRFLESLAAPDQFSNRRADYLRGGRLVFQPWKLLANYSNYIFGWLLGYSGFLGPIAGVMICDYFRGPQKNHSRGGFVPAGAVFMNFPGALIGAPWRRLLRERAWHSSAWSCRRCASCTTTPGS